MVINARRALTLKTDTNTNAKTFVGSIKSAFSGLTLAPALA